MLLEFLVAKIYSQIYCVLKNIKIHTNKVAYINLFVMIFLGVKKGIPNLL